jgi:hypothetical protein
MPESHGVLYSDNTEMREAAFAEAKTGGRQMVHRLRDWEEGQTIWGWETHVESGGSMGKTHTRRDFERRVDDSEPVRPQVKAALVDTATGQLESTRTDVRTAGFVWVAEIADVHTEPPGPDPGEPPLKDASLTNLSVVWSDVTEAE